MTESPRVVGTVHENKRRLLLVIVISPPEEMFRLSVNKLNVVLGYADVSINSDGLCGGVLVFLAANMKTLVAVYEKQALVKGYKNVLSPPGESTCRKKTPAGRRGSFNSSHGDMVISRTGEHVKNT